jgi:hypothetical protein
MVQKIQNYIYGGHRSRLNPLKQAGADIYTD